MAAPFDREAFRNSAFMSALLSAPPVTASERRMIDRDAKRDADEAAHVLRQRLRVEASIAFHEAQAAHERAHRVKLIAGTHEDPAFVAAQGHQNTAFQAFVAAVDRYLQLPCKTSTQRRHTAYYVRQWMKLDGQTSATWAPIAARWQSIVCAPA